LKIAKEAEDLQEFQDIPKTSNLQRVNWKKFNWKKFQFPRILLN